MNPAFSGHGRAPRVIASSTAILETAAAGETVATLSVAGARRQGWSFSLIDNAGARFSIDGAALRRGATPLNQASNPSPAITVQASQGSRRIVSRIALTVRRSFPSLPLPVGARVMAIGDSLTGFNNYTGAPVATGDAAASSYAYGAIEQALSADPRFDFDSWFDSADPLGRNLSGANQGVFGDHLQRAQPGPGGGILPRLRTLMARSVKPSICVLLAGMNTINAGDDGAGGQAAYVIGRLDQCLQTLHQAGVWTVLGTLHPRADWPAGDERQATLLAVNGWIRAQAGRAGVLGVWDGWQTLQFGGTANTALFLADRVHPSQAGSLAASIPLLAILRAAVSPGLTFNPDPTVANLYPQGIANMSGTGGVKVGTAVSGSVADNITVQGGAAGAASTVICSKETVAGAMERQVLTINPLVTAGDAYENAIIAFPNITAGLPLPGSWIRMQLFVEIGATDAFSAVRYFLDIRQTNTKRAGAGTMTVFTTDMGRAVPGNRSFWLNSKPMMVPTSGGFDRFMPTMNIIWRKNAAPGATIKLSRPIVRVIPDPRPGWGY